MDYQNYKTWLTGVNSKGEQPQFNAESDARIKKFVVDSVGGDDILRKMMMLNFISDNIIDKSLADIYIMKRLVGDRQ